MFVKSSVEYLQHMGSDLAVVNAARVSFAKEAEEFKAQDEKLIGYLARHGHWTPFAHTGISFRIKAPIFVARQAGKHQVGLVWNEVSRRYVDSDPEFYDLREFRARADSVKQGSASHTVDNNEEHINEYQYYCETLSKAYKTLLENNVAPELARAVLPQTTMTEWWWTGSLHAFARVCKQRLDPHAQKEIQDIAAAISVYCERFFPVSWKALMEN